MNIITKGDIKKFVKLLGIGLKNGQSKDMHIYTSATTVDGTNVASEYFVSIELKFKVKTEFVDDMISEDNIESDINDMLGNLN